MPITRSTRNGFEVVDWTQELLTVPNTWGTLQGLGIFQSVPVAEHVVTFEEIQKDGGLLVDRVRGDKAPVAGATKRKLHTFAVPHFPVLDSISPQDVQGKRAYGSQEVEQLSLVRARKLERMRRSMAWTLEFARAQLITSGTVYSPTGTVDQDWYAEFGVTRKSIDFTLGTPSTNVVAKIESAIAHIQDHASGEMITEFVALTSPEFFAKLIAHASVQTAYQYYASTQDILRSRAGGATAMHREFIHGGVRFIEMRDTTGGTLGDGTGTRHIPAGKAYVIPRGTEIFRTYFSPANRFGLVNTLGEESYVFETQEDDTQITLTGETNFVNALLRPAMVVELTTSN